jgi:hypothetical protein
MARILPTAFGVPILTAPANVEVETVSVAVKYPIVGLEVAPTAPLEVQYVRVFGEPEPEREEPRLRQLPETAKQPAVMLKPLAAVVEPVFEMAKSVVVALVAVVDEIKKTFAFVSAGSAAIDSLANGEVVPTPTFPPDATTKLALPEIAVLIPKSAAAD